MSRAAPSSCVDCGAGCCTHVARALDAKDARIAELTRDLLERNWQLARIELPRIMSARDDAIRERDEARRELVRAMVPVGGMLGESPEEVERRAIPRLRGEAERRWPGSGEVLFP